MRVLLLKLHGKALLELLRHDLGGKLAKPGLEHAGDLVGVADLFREQIDVELSVEAALPVLDLWATAWDAVEAFLFAVGVEVAVIG